MRHCENCGSELPTKARFCRHCGQSLGSETELTTNVSDAPIEDLPISSLATSTDLSGLQNLASENDAEEEQHTSPDNLGSTGSLPRDLDPEPGKSANQSLDEHSEYDQMLSEKLEALSPRVSARGAKPRSISIPKLLLIFLTVLIVAAGGAAALIGLFQGNLPGTRGAANALSSSSDSEIVNTAGPSLNASICASSSTPSTPGTSGGISLTLSTTSGCSSFNSAIATSLCLIFPYNPGAFHRYILDVSNVTIDSKAYHLVLSLAQYTGSTTYNDAVHITVGIGEGSTGRNFSWLYHSGNVTINSDEQSGTMNVILASQSSGNTIHVLGGWTCGRLIKNS
jgi:zinc-ribbon domain